MKKLVAVILALFSVIVLASCTGGSESNVSSTGSEEQKEPADVQALVLWALEEGEFSGGTLYSSGDAEGAVKFDDDLLRGYYGDAAEAPVTTDFVSYCAYIDETKPVNPCETGVFEMVSEEAALLMEAYINARIQLKLANAVNYPSIDTTPLTTAVVKAVGKYVYYTAVKDINASVAAKYDGAL